MEIDEKVIVSSTGALALSKVPDHLVVVGGGVIGLEMGSVWKRLGAKVTVVEYLDTILGTMDNDVSKQFQRILAEAGHGVQTRLKSHRCRKRPERARKSRSNRSRAAMPQTIEADIVLVATGRRAYTDGLGLEALGVEMERGKVKTDGHWQTNIKGIYAIGDVIDGPMLAHKAEDEGHARRRGSGRAGGPCELQCHSGRGLHPAGSCFRWGNRRRTESCRYQICLGQVSLHGQWPRAGDEARPTGL